MITFTAIMTSQIFTKLYQVLNLYNIVLGGMLEARGKKRDGVPLEIPDNLDSQVLEYTRVQVGANRSILV